MDCLKILNKKISGMVNVPPSKSDAHRAIICASLAHGRSIIRNVDLSKDIEATIGAMRELGTEIKIEKDGNNNRLIVDGYNGEMREGAIRCKESGSTLRFLIPIMMHLRGGGVITGEGKLVERPLDVYLDLFKEFNIQYELKGNRLPLDVKGRFEGGKFNVRGDISSQFITGLMFILPLLKCDSEINITTELQSKGYIDLTLRVLKDFGIIIENNNYEKFFIKGNQKYRGREYSVEGDYSQSAFWLVGGILGEEINLQSLSSESVQGDKVILNILKEMGAKISVSDEIINCMESNTKGIEIDVAECPDLAPILTVLGTFSEGVTRIVNGERLRIKESDRLKSISTELKKLGAHIEEGYDWLEIRGGKELSGGIVDSWNDHRIAMSLAIASIKCNDPIYLTGWKSIEKSYPRFFEDFESVGGEVCEWKLGE